MKTTVLVLSVLVGLVGCASVPDAGSRVKYVRNDASRFKSCTPLGNMDGLAGWDGEAPLQKVRRAAAERGATHVNVLAIKETPTAVGVFVDKVTVEAFKCPTDVGGLE